MKPKFTLSFLSFSSFFSFLFFFAKIVSVESQRAVTPTMSNVDTRTLIVRSVAIDDSSVLKRAVETAIERDTAHATEVR